MLALGIGVAGVTATLPSEGGYAGIGPNFIPAVVAGGIIALGVWLAIEAFTGGWRDAAASTPSSFEPTPFVWVSAGLFAHMALIGWAGFVIAGTALFACVARGFGSRRIVRDLAIALVLSRRDLPVLRQAAQREPAGGLARAGARRRGHLTWKRSTRCCTASASRCSR